MTTNKLTEMGYKRTERILDWTLSFVIAGAKFALPKLPYFKSLIGTSVSIWYLDISDKFVWVEVLGALLKVTTTRKGG